ncbi:metallophosphoesterase [Cohnella sp. WQ 127256]|uniref:metallophosphoesterase family protein n=1 Tax=Cohnella sp. WQ 127256 TaxID=2938790 RepID=UPI0021186CAC|nr:metallophosphoesterase [Cohnella sp. WQ 127256]
MKTTLPEYYLPMLDQTSLKAERLQTGITTNFVFITDMHHHPGGNQLNAAEAIRKLAETVPLDFVVSGGDMSLNGPKASVVRAQKEIMDGIAAVDVPMLPLKGNHDDNSVYGYNDSQGETKHVLFPEETFELVLHRLDNTVTFDGDNRNGMYYYMDIPYKQTRVVVLNSIDIPYSVKPSGGLKYSGQWKYAFSNRQLNWVAHQALDLSNKPDREHWKVLFFSHVAILQDGVKGADHEVANSEAMWGIIQSFLNGTSYSGKGSVEDFEYDLAVDFSAQGAVKVVACLFGHVHCDQAFKKDDIWMISTLNAASYQEFEDCPERTFGTASESAFDLMQLDGGKSVMHILRIGAGEDRSIEY